jgi:hypothetical protein
MNRVPSLLLALLVSTGLPLTAAAQDADAEQLRYDAAIAFANLLMVDNDYEAAAAQANEAVAAQMTASVLENAWAQVEAQVGALHSLEPKSQSMIQGFHAVMLSGDFDAGTFDVMVAMADDHSVAGISVRPPS